MEKTGIHSEDIDLVVHSLAHRDHTSGPCHCSGDEARILFYEEYKGDFIEIGVGKEIKIQ